MLRSNTLACRLLHQLLGNITKRDHAHRLPDTQPDSGSHTTVETLDARSLVDVAEGVADGHLLGTVRVLLLGLHLHAYDFDGLVPGGKTTTEGGGEDLLRDGEFLRVVGLAGRGADAVLTVKGKVSSEVHR